MQRLKRVDPDESFGGDIVNFGALWESRGNGVLASEELDRGWRE